MTRLTFDESYERCPLWTPDGKRIVFARVARRNYGVYWKAADGTGKDEKLGSYARSVVLSMVLVRRWKNLGLLTGVDTRAIQLDIGMLSMEGDRKWKPLLQEKYHETQPQISPDGRWMAYVSDESGKSEVYVRPFPDVDKGKWQVSTSGGDSPLWSPDGRELFYRRR